MTGLYGRSRALGYRRYNDVLFVLQAAKGRQWGPVTRIQMQKLVYLVEVLAPAKDLMLALVEFRFWNHGPYSSALQNSLDHLVCNGLVNVDQYEWDENAGVERTRYSISTDGMELVQGLFQLTSNREHYALAEVVCRLVDRHGLNNVVNVVYQEPTFRQLYEQQARGRAIPIHDRGTNLTLQWIREIVEVVSGPMKYRHFELGEALKVFADLLWAKHSQSVRAKQV